MKSIITSSLVVLFSASMLLAQQSKTAAPRKLDPCTLASKAEIQEALGMSVSDLKLNPKNQTLCECTVGSFGTLSFFVRQGDPNDKPDAFTAELKRRNMQFTEVKGVGDRSFFVNQGYGMVQLNTYKGSTYVIITMLVPGTAEAKSKEMVTKLMQKVISKM
jgi:hypothetical protein